jgi:high-affinity iron transporter
VIVFGTSKPASAATVSVSEADCGKGFGTPPTGQQTFQMRNTGSSTSEVYLIDPTSGAIYGEIEGLAPGTTRALTVTIGGGEYAWRCVPSSGKAVTSAAVHVSGTGGVTAFLPATAADLAKPLAAYQAYIERGLATLVPQARALESDIAAGDLTAARRDWLTAHLTYSTLGAPYHPFGDFNKKINGRADGLPGGVHDPGFTGFHRIEYGLWHGESAVSLLTSARQLVTDVKGLQAAFPTQAFDPNSLALRTHEILENTLQFELTADTDEGSGTNLATAQANVAGTRELLTLLTPLINARSPHLVATVEADLARFSTLLAAQDVNGVWTPVERLGTTDRQQLNGALSQLLEDLSPIPDLLEIRKAA